MDIQTIEKDLLNELLQRALNSERHRYAYDMRNSPAGLYVSDEVFAISLKR